MTQNFTPNEKTTSKSNNSEILQMNISSLEDELFANEIFKKLDDELLEPSESIISKIIAYSKR
ncbi:hypothetical protein EOJ36_03670 [Sandaracinomonas limnophila]|uniref:Uncharacterized protein n=1 Tax=Sandaracinomonas limnophila TaxID=1862386 RepID=A0A437PTG1_9BACT|nr:hypothetical protein EOJ36_03670 [Sandaracinomonas limnophila]